ncbi:hypothetical protein D7D52_17015 [Nocardia yunnanensis]|uniref:Uncharacterized protein n=1 Tax=Nocardia yunnanensis TaxID=2382165 RepID=A0A386ZCF7_9NOCA|nr:hypothetical protein [Nocardia yunnanensis]AYF75290.1 hypothetical protein D7D52_17015 [Nocardia yunnanensis]
MDAHLAVDLGGDGLTILHFRAEWTAAKTFAEEFVRHHLRGAVVIDDEVSPEMKVLPYQRLYR